MKEYATLVTSDISSPYVMAVSFSRRDVRQLFCDDGNGAIQGYMRAGWRVIASAIEVDIRGVSQPTYRFVLERDIPEGEQT